MGKRRFCTKEVLTCSAISSCIGSCYLAPRRATLWCARLHVVLRWEEDTWVGIMSLALSAFKSGKCEGAKSLPKNKPSLSLICFKLQIQRITQIWRATLLPDHQPLTASEFPIASPIASFQYWNRSNTDSSQYWFYILRNPKPNFRDLIMWDPLNFRMRRGKSVLSPTIFFPSFPVQLAPDRKRSPLCCVTTLRSLYGGSTFMLPMLFRGESLSWFCVLRRDVYSHMISTSGSQPLSSQPIN